MFYLYTGKGTRTCLDVGDEFDIIATMGEYLQKDKNMWFKIVHYDEITTEPNSITIHSEEEYLMYTQSYYNKLLGEKTCVELKKEILDIKGVEAPKTKRFTKK